jgi:hypothetical protein
VGQLRRAREAAAPLFLLRIGVTAGCGGTRLWEPALRRLRKQDQEFEASLGYIASSCLKKKKKCVSLALKLK